MSGEHLAYPMAVNFPFEAEAEGGQVPDMYSFPTQTSVMRTQFVLSTAPNSTDIDFIVQPNLFCTIASSFPYATTGLGTTFTPITGGYATNNTTIQPTINSGAKNSYWENGMISPTVLSGQYARYRVVGWGVRIRSLIPPLSQQGTVALTKVPSLSHWFNPVLAGGAVAGLAFQQTTTATNPAAVNYASGPIQPGQSNAARFTLEWPNYLQYYELPGVDSSGYMTSSVLSLPLAHQMSVQSMTVENGLEVAGKLASPDAFKWRDGSNAVGAWGGSINIGSANADINIVDAGQMLIGTTNAFYSGVGALTSTQPYANMIVGVNDEDFVQQGGWSVLCFRASGLQANAASTAQFTVEIVFHIEGVPSVGATTMISGAKYPLYHPGLLSLAQEIQHTLPTFRKLITGDHHHRHRILHDMGRRVWDRIGGRVKNAGLQLLHDTVVGMI